MVDSFEYLLQGFVEFRYNLGSGPAILRSLRKVTNIYDTFHTYLASTDISNVRIHHHHHYYCCWGVVCPGGNVEWWGVIKSFSTTKTLLHCWPQTATASIWPNKNNKFSRSTHKYSKIVNQIGEGLKNPVKSFALCQTMGGRGVTLGHSRTPKTCWSHPPMSLQKAKHLISCKIINNAELRAKYQKYS